MAQDGCRIIILEQQPAHRKPHTTVGFHFVFTSSHFGARTAYLPFPSSSEDRSGGLFAQPAPILPASRHVGPGKAREETHHPGRTPPSRRQTRG